VVPVRCGRALFDAAPEPKEGWFAPEAGHEDLAHYGSLDAGVAFIERRVGAFMSPSSARLPGSCTRWLSVR